MLHTITALVENHYGVLSKVSGLFSGRGFNIKSLTVGETEDHSVSRMTIVVGGDEYILDQVKKQLNKLIDVIKVIDLTEKKYVERELAFIKVNAKTENKSEIFNICDVFRCNVVDMGHKSMIVEGTGPTEKIDALIDLLKPFGIIELGRTGVVAMLREERSYYKNSKEE